MAGAFVLDANVLYSARLRDLFLQLSHFSVVHIHWTAAIEAEWMAALVEARPHLRGAVENTARIIRAQFPLAYLPVDATPVSLGLPDAGDEHVAQAAHSVGAAIVTFNLADFPADLLQPHRLKAITPDEALSSLIEADAERVQDAVRAIRARLKSPPVSAADYVEGLAKAGCPNFADWLRQRLAEI